MKSKILLIIFFASFSSTGQNIKALDEKNGFRDMKFGSDISTFQNMKEVERSSDELSIYYIKTDDKLKIGTGEVQKITYGFYKGKLYVVLIKINGLTNSRDVLLVMQELYGNGYKSNEYIEEYFWLGKKVTASYEENSVTSDATIIFSNEEITAQKEKDKKEANKKAKSDM